MKTIPRVKRPTRTELLQTMTGLAVLVGVCHKRECRKGGHALRDQRLTRAMDLLAREFNYVANK